MTIDIAEIELKKGSHPAPNGTKEGCLLEWASYLAGEPWSDHPKCVSPIIASFGRRWNDDLDDESRQVLDLLEPPHCCHGRPVKPHTEVMLRTIASNAERLERHVDLLIEDDPEVFDKITAAELSTAVRSIVRLARDHGYLGDMDRLTAAMRGPDQVRETLEMDKLS